MDKTIIRTVDRSQFGYYDHQRSTLSYPRDRTRPLPYLRYGDRWTTKYSPQALNELTMPGYGIDNPLLAQAYAKAYDKFVSQVKSNAQMGMGENLAQASKTLEMVADRLTSVYNYATLNWQRELARRNRLRRRRVNFDPLKDGIKKPGSWWLELHFGWEPLIKDIYTGLKLLSEPQLPYYRATGRGSVTGTVDRSHPRDWRFGEVDISTIQANCLIQSNVRITSPNLLLANQMGVINPIGIAWELVPFSFAIDWFVPVGTFLNSYTDLAGVSLEKTFTTFTDRVQKTYVSENPYDLPENNLRIGNAYRVDRRVGQLPIPSLFSRRGNGIRSITRGATAVALLVGFLGKRP